MRRLIKIEKINRRYLIPFVLLLCGNAVTMVNAQTVTYNYDSSGNVISKVVSTPLQVTNFSIKKDTISLFSYLSTYSPSWTPLISKCISDTSNKKTPATSRISNITVADKKKDSKND